MCRSKLIKDFGNHQLFASASSLLAINFDCNSIGIKWRQCYRSTSFEHQIKKKKGEQLLLLQHLSRLISSSFFFFFYFSRSSTTRSFLFAFRERWPFASQCINEEFYMKRSCYLLLGVALVFCVVTFVIDRSSVWAYTLYKMK